MNYTNPTLKDTFVGMLIGLVCGALAVGVPILALVCLAGCNEKTTEPDPVVLNRAIVTDVDSLRKDNVGVETKRFTVEHQLYFTGGYNNNQREVFIVTDTQTGIQYLAITGCGTTELHTARSGKSTIHVEE